MDKIYIILPVHNRLPVTECFIQCLKTQTYCNYHLILVDDGSKDGTAKMVQEQIQSLTVLKGDGNLWWAGSLQRAIDWLKHNDIQSSDIILMMNDDVTFDNFFLEKSVQLLEDQQRTLMLVASFGNAGHPVNIGMHIDLKHGSLEIRQATTPDEINCLATRGLFLRFADLMKIGDFHPKLLPHYYSDYEFTIRAYKKGFNLAVTHDLNLVVNEETTGFYHFDGLDFLTFIKRFFSKKNPYNPIYWSVFVILTYPKILIPINLLRIIKITLISIGRNAIREFNPLIQA